MNLALPHLRLPLRQLAFAFGSGAAILLVAAAAADPGRAHLTATLAAVFGSAAVGLVWPRRMLYALVGWLVVLGLVRRLLALSVPSPVHDPLLLVEPVALVIALAAGTRQLRTRPRTALATGVTLLAVVIGLSALNPRQGSPVVGAAGLLFLLVPLAGFWIGRILCDDATYGKILLTVCLLSVPAAVYGLIQTAVGFPRWDQAWIDRYEQGYQALNVGIAVRAFSTFPSFAEYAYFVAIGLVIWVTLAFRSLRAVVAVPVICLLATALVLASVRTVLFLFVAALIAMLLARIRIPPLVAACLAVAALVGVSAVAGRLVPSSSATSANAALLQHQVQGLANPLDPSSSTLLTHLSLITDGVRSAVSAPFGSGAGTVSLAAAKFGGVANATEADPSNLAVATGLPGLLLYFVIAILALSRAFGLASERRDPLSLVALAILIVTFLQWFNGGQYGVALLVWITIGWIDRRAAEGVR